MDKQGPQDCPTPESLRGLLSGELAAGVQEAVTQHIESCPSCQHTLDGWLSSPSIEGLAAAGKASATQEAALRDLMDQIKKKSVGETTQAEAGAENRDDSLAFLMPSTKPSHLGRLGQYEVLSILGKGGFGTVFRAFDEKLHRVVAIKVLAPELAVSGTARKRFVREAQAAAAVKSDHIVSIYNVADEANPPYLVMELIDGISLEDRLKNEGALDLKEILRIGMQIAEGLAAAHKQGLIHRDIKPGNILLENGVQRVKITDFGLARAADDASVTQSGVIAGTPMFMSPEQAEGLPLDQRSDLFSLGSVLYVMCTGRPPFRANTTMAVLKRVCDETPTQIREINPDVPDWLCAIVEKLQAKKVDERFGSSKDVAELLGKHLADVQAIGRTGPRRAEPRERPVEAPAPTKSNPPLTRLGSPMLIAASLAAVALLAVLGVIFWPRGEVVPPEKKLVENKTPEERKTPPVVVPVKQDNEGWVSLFNGKDLAGWNTRSNNRWVASDWKTADGAILGDRLQTIFTERRFSDFHLKIQVKHDDAASGGIIVRRGEDEGNDRSYYVKLRSRGTAASGSLYSNSSKKYLGSVSESAVPSEDWYSVEVIARGDRLIVKVAGKEVVNAVDADPNSSRSGRIGLDNADGKSPLRFRKIEIKELPPEEPGWVQLFNGKDLTGWKGYSGQKVDPPVAPWVVANGELHLVPDRKWTYLRTEKPYKDYVLELEYKRRNPRMVGPVVLTHISSVERNEPQQNVQCFSLTPASGATVILRHRSLTGPDWWHAGVAEPGPHQEWTRLRIVCQGNNLDCFVNDDHAGRAVNLAVDRGHIGFDANLLDEVSIRNIRIMELDKAEPGFVKKLEMNQALWHCRLAYETFSRENNRCPTTLAELKKHLFKSDKAHALLDAGELVFVEGLHANPEFIITVLLHEKDVQKQGGLVMTGEMKVKSVTSEQLKSLKLARDTGEPGWVQLFNGKDLTGWSVRRNDKWGVPDWKADAGEILGDHLQTIFTERKFSDFHLKLQVKHDDASAGGILLRRGEDDGDDRAYYVKLRSRGAAASGSLYSNSTKKYLGSVPESAVPSADWYRVEVIAQGDRLIVKIAEKEVVNVLDTYPKASRSGRIGLDNADGKSPLRFRKLEIKEL